jgi:hypothetical protein
MRASLPVAASPLRSEDRAAGELATRTGPDHVDSATPPAPASARTSRRRPKVDKQNEEAVTPVLGTIMVLGITVVGIAGIMLWGAPAIARIQAQNAQLAMVGEFEDLRASTQELSVPDHSRFPTIVMDSGSLGLRTGTRFLVTANFAGAANTGCDFRVTEWADADTNVDVAATSCGASATDVHIASVAGSNTVLEFTGDLGNDVGNEAFSSGDWAFFLRNDAGTTTYAVAWLLSTDQLAWSNSGGQSRAVYLDGGAVLSETEGTVFLQKQPALGDLAFGEDYVGFWLRTLDAPNQNSVTGRGSYQVYFALTGNHLRIDEQSVYRVRYDFFGTHAEAWCNSLLHRNSDFPDLEAPAGPDAVYAVTTGATCATSSDPNGVRSLTFTHDGADAFEYRLLHAQIHATLNA